MWDLFYLQRTLGIFLDHVQDLKCWLKIVIVEKKEAFFFVKLEWVWVKKNYKGFFVDGILGNFGLLVRKLSQYTIFLNEIIYGAVLIFQCFYKSAHSSSRN